jgi:hypothetical protein
MIAKHFGDGSGRWYRSASREFAVDDQISNERVQLLPSRPYTRVIKPQKDIQCLIDWALTHTAR